MTAVIEAQHLLRQAAEPRPVGDSVSAAIRRAARLAGLSYSRAENIWYGNARQIKSEEMDRLRTAVQSLNERLSGVTKNEYAKALDQLTRIDEITSRVDPEFYSVAVAAFRDALRGVFGKADPTRRVDRPINHETTEH